VKIRMLEERTGPRHDGRMWPPVGGEIDVDDEEGAAVCAAGWAQPVAQERKAETRPAPDMAEKRAAAKPADKKQ
jgi:hypothetical protein